CTIRATEKSDIVVTILCRRKCQGVITFGRCSVDLCAKVGNAVPGGDKSWSCTWKMNLRDQHAIGRTILVEDVHPDVAIGGNSTGRGQRLPVEPIVQFLFCKVFDTYIYALINGGAKVAAHIT